ncbi:aminopeptidase [Candidatus Desantisbacteria bacterium CG_4_10_14_0_8_um_filter_48_22]|uniref:Aminopeptidase n=1 Tax=Candidatus Desantisbacteria bacterium CG_4_10_14_0_8_um_filter_48_22 TaxID=1974543 RepID=A0A2M7SF42_9BACT|nr:MAG: hypothetical protein AUJ67_03935 [Candidatus Desantisbacteria bacterium CG1_02_49_89]PIV57290.1 MAG: aminopeptidase [Candidatus Desantisbacteria bacterium CG02_land_8_20_14_3_00_49_13]PIZ17923.1 MAG: aminopeptidase [Candidatus Desantisbacteria bacterium CG_4_10_14_0_8_um_filter_48_22]PJB27764.1 MAG: aminopeptidase [Candidatus Desantisbacteria bacterium CG_4_9_14_3_um_filter_50_7]
MKVFIFTDLEGVAGVADFESQTYPGGRYYEQAKHLLTQETNACVEGLIEAKAKEIIVLDGHGCGGIIPDELHKEARLISGTVMSPPFGLDNSYDAVILLAHHAMAGVEDGNLNHSYSSTGIFNMWFNDELVGEIGLEFALAGYFGIPIILVTGDSAACREAKSYIKTVETVVVKEGINRRTANALSPGLARELIKAKAKTALKSIKEMKRYKLLKPPFSLKIQFISSDSTERHVTKPGCLRIDSRTVQFKSDDFLKMLQLWI